MKALQDLHLDYSSIAGQWEVPLVQSITLRPCRQTSALYCVPANLSIAPSSRAAWVGGVADRRRGRG